MRCQSCHADAPTRHVTFYQNIGLLVMRFPSSVNGNLCKRCIHRFFWKMTLTSLVAGWWGIISFFTNIFYVLNNVVQYTACLSMSSARASNTRAFETASPELHPFSEERISRFNEEIQLSITAGEKRAVIHQRISDKANVPPRQVELYIRDRLNG